MRWARDGVASAVKERRKTRFRATPSRLEVNLRAIPVLPASGWRLLSAREVALAGAVPKDYLAYGLPRRWTNEEPEQDPLLIATSGFIAKKGRFSASARECVTEEVISKIGAMLPVKMAKSRLVRIPESGGLGTARRGKAHAVRFLSRDFVDRRRYELRHGMELAAAYFDTTAEDVASTFGLGDKGKERDFYTVDNVLEILNAVYPDVQNLGGPSRLETGLAKMLTFDAFVGAPDRHAMNWGVLAPVEPGGPGPRFAPLFDTARGLFGDHSDADLLAKSAKFGRKRFVERYAERSRPILGIDGGSRVSHFDLVAWIANERRDILLPGIREVLGAVRLADIEFMLQRRFRRIITQVRIGFIMELLEVRLTRLARAIKR